MFKKDEEFNYEIVDGFDHIIEEKGNKFIALRKISWNGRDPKIDLRSYFSNELGEKMGKGIGLTEEGTNTLTNVLVKEGFGNTKDLLVSLTNREDFESSIKEANKLNETVFDADDLLNMLNDSEIEVEEF